jgi:GTP-sensing pleiotropic transcriptional regulator CodY
MNDLLQRVDATLAEFEHGAPRKNAVSALLADVREHLVAQVEAETARVEDQVRRAVSTVSYSEQEAVLAVLGALPDEGGLIVASRIADEKGLTRSIIVSGLNKLESGGVIQARSLGMKGTNVKPLIPAWKQMVRQALQRQSQSMA